jgi:hypothetical protein
MENASAMKNITITAANLLAILAIYHALHVMALHQMIAFHVIQWTVYHAIHYAILAQGT